MSSQFQFQESMFESFKNLDLSNHQSTKQNLKKILNDVTAQPHSFFKEIQSHPNLQDIYNYLSLHPQIGFEIILSSMSIQDSLTFMEGDIQKSKILKLFCRICIIPIQNKCIKLIKLSTKYSSIQKQLVLLKCTAEYGMKQCQISNVCNFVPNFIRLEAFIIEKYLKIKNQPSKNSEDYIESDLRIVKHCQKWASQALIQMMNSLPTLNISQKQEKKILLICLSDIYTALLEAIRQNNLSKEILGNILQSANRYMFRSYTFEYIYNQFIMLLKNNKFYIPMTKLQIKQSYDTNMNINAIGYSYWSVIYQQESILNEQLKLKYLIPSYCQMVSKPYEFKEQIQNLIINILGQSVKVVNGFQWNYPIELFLFYSYHYDRNFYKIIHSKLSYTNKIININSLNILKSINIEGINTPKEQYILLEIQSNQLFTEKKSKIPLKNLKLEDVKNQQLFIKVIQKFVNIHGKQSAKQLVSWNIFNKENKNNLQQLILN